MNGVALAIETSNPSSGHAGVALARTDGARIVSDIQREPLAPTSRHADDLMPAVARLCARERVTPGELTRVIVSLGPGGYTGVRIAVTTAKLLAEAAAAVLVGVPSASVARNALAPGDLPALVCLASKGTTTYGVRFEGDGPDGRVLGLLDASGLETLGVRTIVGDRHLPAGLRERAVALGARIVEPTLDAGACLRLGLDREPDDPASLAPIYPREPEAVRRWRELHGG